jgi:NAD(P)-dependent dehydrogenase (short-subunit alcohol dehydrogenase family)
MAGVERRRERLAREKIRDRGEDLAPGAVDRQRFVPRRDRPKVRDGKLLEVALAVGAEIGRRSGDDPAAGAVAAPEADRCDRRVAELEAPGRGAPQSLGELGTAEQVAKATAFLCSPDAAYMTGSVLLVDGGASLFEFAE